jgi:hypothetical protein
MIWYGFCFYAQMKYLRHEKSDRLSNEKVVRSMLYRNAVQLSGISNGEIIICLTYV